MKTITLGTVAIALPSSLAAIAAASPALAGFLDDEMAPGDKRTLETALDGAEIGGERTSETLEMWIKLGGDMHVSLFAEELEGDQVSFSLTYGGHDGAFVNRLEKASLAGGTLGDVAQTPPALAGLSTLRLGSLDEEYDRNDRRYNVSVELDEPQDLALAAFAVDGSVAVIGDVASGTFRVENSEQDA